jgi:hypothetical protein
MSRPNSIAVVSDIHYACRGEQARGNQYESRVVSNVLLRLLVRSWRHFIWLREPLNRNHLLDAFIERAGDVDYVIANGDYSCDTAFVGVSDDAACDSARECLGRLRARFGSRLRSTIGDHELGKFTLIGACGGLRLRSFERAVNDLELQPFWTLEIGRYVLVGLASTLFALDAFRSEILPGERAEWDRLRSEHVDQVRRGFAAIPSDARIVLFCHDPTALPFVLAVEEVRARLEQIELTVIGHLHSNLIFWKSRLLAGMPAIPFLGPSVKRITSALNRARCWHSFRPRLCPSLAGIELLKDGGFLTLRLDPRARVPIEVQVHRLPR